MNRYSRLIFLFSFIALFGFLGNAWGQKPTIMAVPTDRYLHEQGFTTEIELADGRSITVPEYDRAFLNDRYIRTALASINAAFQDAGYPIQDFEAATKRVDFRRTELLASERPIQQSMRDAILSQARADILLEVDFFVEKVMGESTVSITIQANDAYTSQAVATVTNTGQPGNATPFSILVREAVVQNMPMFEQRLTNYFNDLRDNGRVGIVEVTLGSDAPFDLEEWIPYGDEEEELGTIVKDLIKRKSLNGNYHISLQSRTQQVYDTVRIPLFDEDGYPIDADSWANGNLVRDLRRDYGLDVRRESIGLSHVRLVILGYR